MNKGTAATVILLAGSLSGCGAATVKPAKLELNAAKVENGITSIAVENESGAPKTDVPVTFGQVFKNGDVPNGTRLKAIVAGKSIPIQVDRKATESDGSLRHAVVTVRVPKLSASGARIVTLATGGTRATGKPVSLGDLLATDFDARVVLKVGDRTLTADARDLLEQVHSGSGCKPWGRHCNLWLSGPVVSEWIVGGPLETKDGASPHLAAYFYVRAYAGDPIKRVRVNVAIENDWTWVKNPHNITYDARITVGDHVYSRKNITNYRQTRWHRVMWWGDPAGVYAKLDGNYLQESKAVSKYADVHPTDKFLDHVRQSVKPMGRGDQTKHMEAAGAQAGIGPLPRWTTAYVLSTDARAFHWMLANDSAAGSYNVFYRDQKTGRPVTILDYPYMTIFGTYRGTWNPHTHQHEAFPKCGGKCADPNRPNAAHEPSIGYVSYMATGDFYYLEQLQFWADWNAIRMNATYRHHKKGLLYKNQVRAQAWDLRTLGDAAFITPDDDPLKSYFVDMMHNNIAWYNKHFPDNPKANVLGAMTAGHPALHYGNFTSLAPWQDDFYTWSIGHLVELGFKDAEPLSRWKARFPVGRMIAPGYCYVYASAYTLKVRDSRHKPIYDSFREVYRNSVGKTVANLKCGSAAMAHHVRDHPPAGAMVGYPDSPTGYPANMQPALAAAVDSGIDGAARAWKLFRDSPVDPKYRNYANFAIVPRPDALADKRSQP
jgi:hypothetical protein